MDKQIALRVVGAPTQGCQCHLVVEADALRLCTCNCAPSSFVFMRAAFGRQGAAVACAVRQLISVSNRLAEDVLLSTLVATETERPAPGRGEPLGWRRDA